MIETNALQALVGQYYATRPNLAVKHRPLCVFFLACSGAGKSTLRKKMVETLQATYVCNDEVRALLSQLSQSQNDLAQLKQVVSHTWQKILDESPNKAVVFDNNIIQYYKHPDSYINVARSLGLPCFVINLDVSETTLRRRIVARGVQVEQLLAELPGQLTDYAVAIADIKPDWILRENYAAEELDALLKHLQELL